jgi:hypothetical protein
VDYYEGVVVDYLRTDRAVFVNTECRIQLIPADPPDAGTHWYCDAVAVDFRSHTVFLCETSYAKDLGLLKKRLKAWNDNWDGVVDALRRDSHLAA